MRRVTDSRNVGKKNLPKRCPTPAFSAYLQKTENRK